MNFCAHARCQVVYTDGDEEELLLAVEQVQLLASAVAALPTACSEHLLALGAHLQSLATKQQAEVAQQTTGRGRVTAKDSERSRRECSVCPAGMARRGRVTAWPARTVSRPCRMAAGVWLGHEHCQGMECAVVARVVHDRNGLPAARTWRLAPATAPDASR
jgi:hypothetical protein